MSERHDNPPVICTDDGWVLAATPPPITVANLRDKVVRAYEGTPAALWWSVGDHEVYQFETRKGEIIGHENTGANVRHLMSTCGGPLTVLSRLCREAGIQFFPRFRMNSHYDMEPTSHLYGRFRREHPELLIGRPGEAIPAGSTEYGLRSGLDYALPAVRAHAAEIICELFEAFEVEGVELDFMRHPAFFRPDEAHQNRYLMTDLVRHVRDRMDRAGQDRGRRIKLAIRVPPTLADSARIGLDVAAWMAQGLVDIVVAGGGFIPYETPIEEFVAAGAGREIAVYGCIEATRYADEFNLRALAHRFWAAGASGVYLYNFYTMSPEWNGRVLNQLADPAQLEHLCKRYELDQTASFTNPYHCAYPCDNIERAFRYASPPAQLPVVLVKDHVGRGALLRLHVADDLEAGTASGGLERCTLALRLDGMGPAGELEVRLNRELLPWDAARVSHGGWDRMELQAQFWEHYPSRTVPVPQSGTSVEFELSCPPLERGDNQLQVRLAAGARSQGTGRGFAVLKGVEVTVIYRE